MNVKSRALVNRGAYFCLLHDTNDWLTLKSIRVRAILLHYVFKLNGKQLVYFCRTQKNQYEEKEIGINFIDVFCELFS